VAVERMQAAVTPALGYLSRLMRGMNQVGVERKAPLFLAAVESFNVMHSLNVKLHFLACDASKREREGKDKRE
jgi:hypothetical protein